MKAKEWKVKFQEGNIDDMLKAYGEETAKLVAARTLNSKDDNKYPAAEGAIREQKTKFAAICSGVESITEAHFDVMVDAYVPEFNAWKQAALKKQQNKVKQSQPEDAKKFRKFLKP